MNEKGVKSIRMKPETAERLAAMAQEEGLDQGSALESLLNAWDLQSAKAAIPNRATEIAEFDTHLQAIQRSYLHALDIAQDADSRARDSFRFRLETLEKEKDELRRKLAEAESAAQAAGKREERATASAIDCNARANTAERRADTLEKTLEEEKARAASAKADAAAIVADKQKLIDSLSAQLAEALEKAQAAERLQAELAKTKAELDAAAASAEIAAAKAKATQIEAVAAVQRETSAQLLRLTEENAALRVELERTKAETAETVNALEKQLEAMDAASAAPMSGQTAPPAPTNAAARRRKPPAKKAAPAPAPNATENAETGKEA